MAVRILHAADFHMDSPFGALPEEKAAERRVEQRKLLSALAEKAEEEKVQIVLLSGDLFDSAVAYWQTQEALLGVLSEIKAEVFIAPGNHDYYCMKSPYAFMSFPENVHIFNSTAIKSYDLPELGCRVWGAGFTSPACSPLLDEFTAPDDGMINIMTVHGEIGGERYNPITEEQIAASGLHYLALGHVHAFSGIKKAGNTTYAYPGCIEGRGFDETGEKGVIIGDVGKDGCDLKFVPMGGRRYEIQEVDLTGSSDAKKTVLEAVGDGRERDIVRVILTGEYSGELDPADIETALKDKFYSVTVRNRSVPARDIWEGCGEDSLTGLFLQSMKAKYDAAESESDRETVTLAVRCALASLEMREGGTV